ncbi:hypothetical protein LES9216_00293 [Leuconostoc suionicum]|uniref:EpsG family protein n=1 Tax=Leuconostoc suionicum TaxID=1511761 RepID=A0A2N9K7P3_9LACO|nr:MULTISPECIES: hypothetical protein [Leuconostoc]AHF19423.1 hypothetical protein LMES_1207 [Leuconostoc mesenteroides KFRI-MG]MCU4664497.1 hypothetical protein [Leuconostoc mesenteroides]SPD91175.1 hypothetical protein LES8486_00146 [Leuconostoc suionicum]SPE06400.1 hypothetical protein LES9216_00293 [Leuconostoc suionicum]SPH02889.1 hypothetical protein LES8484_00146 [Leuconostoc suionicum]
MTLILFILSPVLSLVYIVESLSKYQSIYTGVKILFIGAIFFFFGFSINLINNNADLARYISWLPNYQLTNFTTIIKEAADTNNLFVIQPLILGFFSKVSDLRFFTGFIPLVFYSCFSYVSLSFIKDIRDKKGVVNSPSLSFYFGLAILSFGWVVTSVRNPMANAIISVALFRDLYLHKKGIITVICYSLGISMHVAVVPIIFCRVIFGIFFSQGIIKKTVSFAVGICLIFIGFNSNVISEFSDKADTYGIGSTGGGFSDYAQSSIYYIVNNIYLLWLMILSIVLLLIIKHQKQANVDLFDFIIFLSCLAILSYFMPTPLIDRYGMIVQIFYPIILMTVDFYKLTKNKKFILIILLSLTGIFGFLWQVAFLSVQIDFIGFLKNIIFGWFSVLF